VKRLRVAPLVLTAALLACNGSETPGFDLGRLPPPPRAGLDDAARNQLEQARAAVAELVAEGADRARLAEAVGHLGRLYHAYELLAEAESGYREAAVLAPDDFRWPYLRGFLLQGRGELDAAAGAYEAARSLRNTHLPLLVRLAEVELARGEAETAEDLLEEALLLDPESAAAHLGLGRLCLETGRPEEAIAHLEQALAADPQASEAHYPLGLAYRERGDTERAREHLARRGDTHVRLVDPPIAALQELARGGDAPTRRGLDALEQGDADTALTELRAAVDSRPYDREARRNLAIALARLDELEAAEAEYRRLLELDPRDAAAHLALGNLLVRRAALDEAVEHFEQAVRLAPDFEQAHFNLATAHAQLGRLDEALAGYERVLELDGSFTEARLRRALVLHEAGHVSEAQAALQAIVDAEPANDRARVALASLLARRGESDEAQRTLEAGLAAVADPAAEARLRLELARLLLAGGSAQSALEQLDRASALEPGVLDIAFERGRALLRLGRYRAATEQLGAVSAARPDFLPAWLAEAEAWLRAGEPAQARDRLEAGLEHHPRNDELGDALARVLASVADDAVRDGERAHLVARERFERRRTPLHAETLAMALAAIGRFDEAVELQRALVASAIESEVGDRRLEALRENLRRYERGERAIPVAAPTEHP
jgi:tetratricopeptide (TPR) repeat protein